MPIEIENPRVEDAEERNDDLDPGGVKRTYEVTFTLTVSAYGDCHSEDSLRDELVEQLGEVDLSDALVIATKHLRTERSRLASCDSCGESYDPDEEGAEGMCDDCFSENNFCCERCGEYQDRDSAQDENGSYCNGCFKDNEEAPDEIKAGLDAIVAGAKRAAKAPILELRPGERLKVVTPDCTRGCASLGVPCVCAVVAGVED